MSAKRKRTVLILAAAVSLFLVFVGFGLYHVVGMLDNSSFHPQNGVAISGNIVDNAYNNRLAGGNLVRIGDRLYFNYYKNTYIYGLMEISSDHAERIYWDGPKWFGSYVYNHTISQDSGQLIMVREDGVYAYSKAFSAYMPLNTIPNLGSFFQPVGEAVVYLSKDSAGAQCLYQDDTNNVLVTSDVVAFYGVGEEVYYYKAANNATPGVFRKYNIANGTDLPVFDLEEHAGVLDFVIEGDYLLFSGWHRTAAGASEHSIYKIDLKYPDRGVETVCAGNNDGIGNIAEIRCWNVYNGKLYVALPSGLKAYTLVSGDEQALCDTSAEECYIVDDLWIYFVDAESNLWRIQQDGGTAEKIFGVS